MKSRLIPIVTASALALVSLSGCETYDSITSYISSSSAGQCPDAAILAGTSVLPAFDAAAGDDPSNVVYTISMTNVTTRCDFSKRDKTVDARVRIYVHATRPPGGVAADYRVPYYLAVTTGGDILDKKLYSLTIHFPEAGAIEDTDVTVDSTEFQVDKAKQPYDYHLLVGFQLTKAQVEYNKKMGRYEP